MRLPLARQGSKAIDKPKGLEIVDAAYERGVNYFDTAYNYHGCTSETFTGEALSRYPRHTYNLATKMPVWLIKTREEAERVFHEQLEKLRVEHFDFYLVHNFNSKNLDRTKELKIYDFLKEKQREGRIHRLGFSFHDTIPVLTHILDSYDWDFAQIQLNYMDWELQDAKGQYELLTSHGIPVIVMEPLRGGALHNLCEPALEILKAAAPSASAASWALRFAAEKPNVLTVLSGMSSVEQVTDNVATLSPLSPLSEREHAAIDQALAAYRKSQPIPCTDCGYCMDCPSGVDIPKVFAIYNRHHDSARFIYFSMDFRVLGEDKQPQHCTRCEKCVELCPQKLPIHDLMETINTFAVERLVDDVALFNPEPGLDVVGRSAE